jgi:protein SCO1/2
MSLPRQKLGLFAAVAALAAIGGILLALQLRPAPAPAPALAIGTWLPAPRALASFSLVDQSGAAATLETLRGQPTLLFFGFTHCPDVCPTTLALVAAARRKAALDGLRVVLVSVDPERDTPERLGAYVRAFDPHFRALTGPADEIAGLARQLGVAAARVPLPGGDYTVDHSAALLWLDRDARLAAIFTPPLTIDGLAADLAALQARS